ncbi:acyl-CoA synthetase [Rhabdothermincola sediminis]|uniref:acyl-CoA synthetase n=1 Tax=Rhabdothermincola sediminis TaxID=2751370 RepID=UPI001AA03246|nr:acyl-CoA synthetase [Rhabdothermincola sediminis]
MEFNLAVLNEAIASEIGDREAIVWRDRRITYAQLAERTRRLANLLLDRGFEVRAERDRLAGWESGQDHLALYLHNGNEYLEGMLGAYKARVAPFNVNYRYVAEELRYLLDDAGARGIIYHSAFAPTLEEVRADLPSLELLLQVPDESGHGLLPDAVWYEDALAAASPAPPPVQPSPDDLYILYTGGTTGMPKGVLWRQADIFPAAMGGRDLATGEEWPDLDAVVASARNGGAKLMPAPPFMHGAAHWMAFTAFNWGNTIVLPANTRSLDAADVWATVQAEAVNILLIVGDAFGRPLLDELERGDYDLSSMLMLVSGGAALSAPVKNRFVELQPSMAILDGLGSSETGQQASQVSAAGAQATTGTFTPGPGMCIVSEDLTRVIEPTSDELGWLAQKGRVPLGYLGDEAKTRKTFPVIDGVRYSVPGDRANYTAEGLLQLHGRDSVTINSGGEKIFAEEVEQALAHHPAVYDVVVTGRPSERWGSEVVAIVQLRDGFEADVASLLAECEKHIARYKLPKDVVFVDRIVRSPAGKADYRWAREVAAGSPTS